MDTLRQHANEGKAAEGGFKAITWNACVTAIRPYYKGLTHNTHSFDGPLGLPTSMTPGSYGLREWQARRSLMIRSCFPPRNAGSTRAMPV
jgi:hypothetical protein